LRSYELKLAWAKHQAQILKRQVSAWHNEGGYGTVSEKHPDRPGHIIRLKVGEIPPSLPLIVGDALYAIRSALDHLAHDLAASFTDPLPPTASEQSEFPIYWDKPIPQNVGNRKLGSMDPKARAIIEGLQPHLRGDAYADDPLWQIYELARVDRHRFVHLTVTQLGGIGIGGNNLHIETLELIDIKQTAGDGTELGYAAVRPIDPTRPMHMNFTPDPQVVFKEGTLVGEPVATVLDKLTRYVETEVVPKLESFLKV